MKKALLLLSVLAIFGCASNETNNSPILTIEGGQVQGVPAAIKGVLHFLKIIKK